MSSSSFKKISQTKTLFPVAQHPGEPQGKVHLKAKGKDVLSWPPGLSLQLSTKRARNSQMRFSAPVQGALVLRPFACYKADTKLETDDCSLTDHWPSRSLTVTGHGPVEI